MRTKALYILTLIMTSFLGMNAQDFILSTGGELKAFHNYELKEAIDAANPNDTIYLGPGSYSLDGLQHYDNGEINVPMLTKPLVFIGAGSKYEPYGNQTSIGGELMLKPETGMTGNYVFEGVAVFNLYMDSADCPVTLSNVNIDDIKVLGKSDSLTLESSEMTLNAGDDLLTNLNASNSIIYILQGQCELTPVFANCNIYEVYMPAEFINSIVNGLYCSGSNLTDSYYFYVSEGVSISGNGKELSEYSIADFIQDPGLAENLGMFGNDGTPVGISGGANPYSDNPPYPAPNTFYSDATYNADTKSMDVSVKILAYNGSTGKDSPDRTASGYRHVLNSTVVGTGSITTGTSEFSLQMPVDDDVKVTDINSREFSMEGNEVTGKYHGYALYNFQMISPSGEWGSLLSKYFEKDYIFTVTPADVRIGEKYNHAKVSECGAFAIKFDSNGYLSTVKTDQDCEMQLLAFVDGNFVNYGIYGAEQLKEGVEIYSPAETIAVFYNTPIDSSNPNSDININVSYSSQNVTYAPALNLDWETNIMTMSSDQPSTTIYYTLDGLTPTHDSSVYAGPFAIEHNMTVNAIAWSEAGGDSEIASMTIDSFYVPEPQIDREGNTYTITNTLEGVTTKYTLDGTDPKSSDTAMEYVAPLTIMEECTLAAYSYKEYFNDSQVNYYQIYPERTSVPVLDFNGETNMMTMATDQSDVTIYYTLDGTRPTHESSVYTGPIAIEHNMTVNAIAWSEAGGDSEMASMTIDWFYVPEPQIDREGNTYTITNSLEGVTTKYTLDGTDPTNSETADEYVAPLTIMEECTLAAYSYKEYFNDSQIIYYQIYPERTSVPTMDFNWDTKMMTMTTDQSDVTIYYTLDGLTPTHESSVYTGPFAIEHNLTVNAIAWSEVGGDSEMASMTIDSFYVPEPQINREGNTYTITNTLEGVTTKYTLDGTDPRSSETAEEYVAPLTIMEECTLAAYSYKEYFNDSQAIYYQVYPVTDPYDPENPITPDDPEKCPTPYVSAYDGHYLTLACPDTDAIIYYTNSQGQNLVYNFPIELENIYGISFYAEDEAKYKAPSDQVYYEPEYYSNSDMIQVRKPGLLKKSVEWQAGVDFENLKVETLNENWLPFAIDDDDFAFLRSLDSVKDLDLSQTGNKSLPAEAFANMGVRSLVLPSTLTTFGKNIFSGCDGLCSLEILADVPLPSDIFDAKAENPNMLLYVANRDNVSQLKESTFVLIWKYGDSYRTEKQELHDGYPYYSHAQYFAKEISYTRVFEKSTPLGGCAGWEGICLPFNVENISYGDKNLMPFGYGSEDGTLNYWLYSYDQNVWQSAGGLYQDKAFIIAMPNNDSYLPEFNISGTVTFSAYNQYVYPSGYDPNSSSQLKANFEIMNVSNDVMVLNDDTYYADGKTFEPGSVFVAGLRGPRPFESYIDNVYGTRYMKVGGTTGVDEMTMMQGFNAWTEGNEIYVSSSIDANVKIFNTTGQLVRIVTVTPGNVSRVGGIPTGIYIVGNKKLYLKK